MERPCGEDPGRQGRTVQGQRRTAHAAVLVGPLQQQAQPVADLADGHRRPADRPGDGWPQGGELLRRDGGGTRQHDQVHGHGPGGGGGDERRLQADGYPHGARQAQRTRPGGRPSGQEHP